MKPSEHENTRYSQGTTNPVQEEERTLLDWVKKNHTPPSIVADLGCGVGTFSKLLGDLGHTVTGYDFSEIAIQKAQKDNINAQKADFDAHGIPNNDNYFDFIWATDIIEHVYDPIGLLREINRTLKPSGCLYFCIPNDLNIKARIRYLLGISPQDIAYKNSGACKHHSVIGTSLLKYMLKASDMQLTKIEGITKSFNKTTHIHNVGFASLIAQSLIGSAIKK